MCFHAFKWNTSDKGFFAVMLFTGGSHRLLVFSLFFFLAGFAEAAVVIVAWTQARSESCEVHTLVAEKSGTGCRYKPHEWGWRQLLARSPRCVRAISWAYSLMCPKISMFKEMQNWMNKLIYWEINELGKRFFFCCWGSTLTLCPLLHFPFTPTICAMYSYYSRAHTSKIITFILK